MVEFVKGFRNSNGICLGIAALLIFSWLFAANHCALGAMGKPGQHSQCCAHESNKSKLPDHSSTKCCEAMAAPLPPLAMAPDSRFFSADFDYTAYEVVVPEAPASDRVAIGPAPPPGSFIEYVLKRCIPANAPPRVA
jgi:hypothetical protein